MLPSNNFRNRPAYFWAHIKLIGQIAGYTQHGSGGLVKAPNIVEIVSAFERNGLSASHLTISNSQPSALAIDLIDYLQFRADILNNTVQHQLMNEAQLTRE